MYRIVCVCVLMTFLIGCDEHKRDRRKPIDSDDVVIDVEDIKPSREMNVATIHKASAAARAQLYSDLADAVESGEIKTINECVDFTNPRIMEISKEYTAQINVLREKSLGEATDTLPDNAAKVFRKFSADYRAAAK